MERGRVRVGEAARLPVPPLRVSLPFSKRPYSSFLQTFTKTPLSISLESSVSTYPKAGRKQCLEEPVPNGSLECLP